MHTAQTKRASQEAQQTRLARTKDFIPSRVPVSTFTWRRWWKAGKAPKPIKIGGMNFWRVDDIDAFIAAAK